MVTIYALRNKANGFVYVGSTKGNLPKRLREHRCLLRAGEHKCSAMQADWLRYGEPQFEIVALEQGTWSLAERREAELRWMGHYTSQLYNEHMISMQPLESAWKLAVKNAHLSPGNRWTPEANLKRSLAQKGIPKGHGAKISATKRAKQLQAKI